MKPGQGHTIKFLTTGQVAARCQVTVPTVRRWIRGGHLASFETVGGHLRVTEEEFERFRAAFRIPGSGGEARRVLIVDDDPQLVDTLVTALGWDKGYKVEAALDGYEGLVKAGAFLPHLLVLDIRMPGLDGFQVCRAVRADPATRSTRILVVTAVSEPSARARIMEAGADAFLEKPFSLTQFEAEVSRLVGREQG